MNDMSDVSDMSDMSDSMNESPTEAQRVVGA